jgi:hypothetical protein
LNDPKNAAALLRSLADMLTDVGSIVSATDFAAIFTVDSMRRSLAEDSTLAATVGFAKRFPL